MPTHTEIHALFDGINVWRRGGQRAPHKPLLLLMTLARVQRGESRLAPFASIEEPLTTLLREFGPQRQSYHPEFPFWRLQNDGDFWEVPERDTVHSALGDRQGGDVPKSILRDHGVSGGFSTDVDAYLRQHPELVNQLAARLLEEHFPGTYTDDLLNAVGMPFVVEPRAGRRPRDPGFRDHILRIYSYRCAVCGYDGRLGHAVLGVEAAHIKWHAASGPDSADNGVALCAMHHKLLDRGALGLTDDLRIQVSQEVHGNDAVDDLIVRYHNQPLLLPQSGQPRPATPHIHWHTREVFKGPARATGVDVEAETTP